MTSSQCIRCKRFGCTNQPESSCSHTRSSILHTRVACVRRIFVWRMRQRAAAWGTPRKDRSAAIRSVGSVSSQPGRPANTGADHQHIWAGRVVAESVLSLSNAKLRKVLEKPKDSRDYLESRYGRGYRFRHEVKLVPNASGRCPMLLCS